MKKLINYFSRVLVSLLLCAGVVVTSCEGENPLGGGESNSKSRLTWSLAEVGESSATFVGRLDVPASDLSFSQVTVYYSDAETFNVNDARKVSTTTFDGDQKFTITITDLEPNVKYSYCLVAKVKSEEICGDVQSFTSKALPSLSLQDVEIEVDVLTVSLVGKVVGMEDVDTSRLDLHVSIKGVSENDIHIDETVRILENGEFRYVIDMNCKDGCQHDASYNYWLSLAYDVYTIDEVSGNFQTYVPKGSISLSSVSYDSAEFVGSIDDYTEIINCPSGAHDGQLQVGIYYSLDSDTAPLDAKMARGDLNVDGTFTVTLDGLASGTNYYYGLAIIHTRSYTFGAVQEFTTAPHPYTLQTDLNVSSATDLSSDTSANCYVISESGLYKFKTVKGNSTASVGSVTSASILWETFGTSTAPEICDLVSAFFYKDGYIAFQTADTFKEGNAVIAANDANGNILWSWHIWFTDQPQGQTYYNNAGTMMDRNLGATSATPGDVAALGLLYQWGRKDPFLGSSSISSSTVAESTISWPTVVKSDSSNGTREYAIAHPTTYVKGTSSTEYDWHYSSRDNTLWTTSDKVKSIYDPCPSHWRVPDGGSNGVWEKAGFGDTTYDSTNRGISFSISSPSTAWYPASGYRISNVGSLTYAGEYGFFWSASPDIEDACRLHFDKTGNVFSSSYDRACGQSVRCVKEID